MKFTTLHLRAPATIGISMFRTLRNSDRWDLHLHEGQVVAAHPEHGTWLVPWSYIDPSPIAPESPAALPVTPQASPEPVPNPAPKLTDKKASKGK